MFRHRPVPGQPEAVVVDGTRVRAEEHAERSLVAGPNACPKTWVLVRVEPVAGRVDVGDEPWCV
jgi:hypothetical protein